MDTCESARVRVAIFYFFLVGGNLRTGECRVDDWMVGAPRGSGPQGGRASGKEAAEVELENVRLASAIKDAELLATSTAAAAAEAAESVMRSQLRIAEKAKEAAEVELESVRRASAIKDAELLATSTAAAAAEAGESVLQSERVAARATEARLRSERDAARAAAGRLAQNESRLRSERNVARVAAAAAAENVPSQAETIDDVLKHLDTSVHEEARKAWEGAAANPMRTVVLSFAPPSHEMLEEWKARGLLTADQKTKCQQLPAAYAKGFVDGRDDSDEPIIGGQDATAVSVDIRGALKLLAEMDKLTSTEIVQRAKEVITHSERSVKATLKTDSRERAAAYIWLITIIMNNSICFVVILHAAVMRCINAMHPISTQLGIGTTGHLVISRNLNVSMQNKLLPSSEESWNMEWNRSSLLTRCRCRLKELKVDRTGLQLRSAVAGVVEEGRRLSSNDGGVDSLRKELLKMSFNENAGWMLRRAIDEKDDDDVLLALRDFIDAYGGDGSSRRLADLASFVHEEEEEEEHPAEAMQTDRRAWDFDVDSDRRFIEPLVLALSAESENGEYDEQLEQLKAMSQKAKLQLAASKVLGKRNSPAA